MIDKQTKKPKPGHLYTNASACKTKNKNPKKSPPRHKQTPTMLKGDWEC